MLEGKRLIGPVGDYDLEVILAERYHWTPEQMAALDPDFLEELTARIRAEGDVQEAKDRKGRRQKRAGQSLPRGLIVEDADIAEID